jgi:hypothetical protein
MSRDGNFPRQRDGVLGPNCGFTHTVLGQMAFSPTWIYQQVNKGPSNVHHDALEFPDSKHYATPGVIGGLQARETGCS